MIFLESGFGTVAEVVGYAAHGKVHLGKAEGGRFFSPDRTRSHL